MGVDPDRYDGVLTKVWGKGAGGQQYSIELTPRFTRDTTRELRAAVQCLGKGLKPLKRSDPTGATDYGLLALSDLHFFQDGDVKGEEHVREAMELGVTLVDEMLVHPRWNVGRVGILLNGDIFDYDGYTRTTTSGTHLEDAFGDYGTMFTTSLAGISSLVNWVARRRLVDVFVVGGNHDRVTAFHLALALELAYEDTDRVRVYRDQDNFLYHRWGKNQFGFHHGHKVREVNKLRTLMATERPRDWGETTHRYWYTGHVHRDIQVLNHTGLKALVPRGAYAKGEGFPPELHGGIGDVFSVEGGRIGRVSRHRA